MLTWSSSASSPGSLYTLHHLPRSAPSLGCASFQPAGSASLNAGGAGASGRWYFGPTAQAFDTSSTPTAATHDRRRDGSVHSYRSASIGSRNAALRAG